MAPTYNSIVQFEVATANTVLLAVAVATATDVMFAVGKLKYFKVVWDLYNCNCICKSDK